MATRAGVGTSRHRDPVRAGREATRIAQRELLEHADQECNIDLALVLLSAGYNPSLFIEGLKQIAPACPLAGCSVEGVITQDGSMEVEYVAAVMLISSDAMSFTVVATPMLSDSSVHCAEALAAPFAEKPDDGSSRLLLLLADGLSPAVPRLLRELDQQLPSDVTVVGGTAGDAFQFERTTQFTHDQVFSDGAVGIAINGSFTAQVALRHGCEPIGLQHEVTRSSGPVVSEIDHRPAWEVFTEYFDVPPSADFAVENSAFMSLAHYTESGMVIRSPFGLDPETGGLMFVGGIEEGTRVHMTHRTVESIRNSAEAVSLEILEKEPGRKPSMVLQFDCAGRGRLLLGQLTTEIAVDPAQRILGTDIPWIGFHTFGEIAPVGTSTWFHNYTVVICAIYDDDG